MEIEFSFLGDDELSKSYKNVHVVPRRNEWVRFNEDDDPDDLYYVVKVGYQYPLEQRGGRELIHPEILVNVLLKRKGQKNAKKTV